MKENSMEELKQRLEELYKTQQARLACNADDLDIREEIAEVEEEIKELEYDINEENNNGNDTNVGSIENSIEENIKIIRSIDTLDDFELENAINHILSDYKRLREYYEEQNEVNAKFIPVQKVKDKIELLEKKAKYEQNVQVLVQLYKQIKVLKEILKEVKKDGNGNHV